jgi:ABC-2 type transport system ATP-binding protein
MNIIEPTRGSISVLGVDSKRLSPRELRRIGYVSENQDMPARMTVSEYLAYLRPFYPDWDRELETAILRRLRLPANRRIGDLSHGMRMKHSLACALPFRPKLLVLDEPFSGLDPLVRDEFMEGLLDQAGDMTILISSHELSEIENMVTHVGFIDEGRLLFAESMSDLAGRFREVRVVLEESVPAMTNPPDHWLGVQTTGNVLTFVDTHFSEARFGEQLASFVGSVRRVDTEPMPLRAIFTTLARACREAAV